MKNVQIVVVVLVVIVLVSIGCYWFWAGRTPQVGIGNETGLAPEGTQQQQQERESQKAQGPSEPDQGEKGPQHEAIGNQNHNALQIQTSQQAIQAVKDLLGWENEGNYSAEKITIQNCFVPFVRKEVSGKAGWEVHIRNLKLKFKADNSEEVNPFINKFICVILAETGQLLQIESDILKGVVVKPDRMPVEKVEKAYSNSFQKIKGLPNESSEMSFSEVLQSAFEKKGSWVSKAKQIVAFYVTFSEGEHEQIVSPQPLWVIYVRDFSPPMELSGPGPIPGDSSPVEVDPGAIGTMRLLFKPDGTPFGCSGGTNIRTPK